MAIAVNIGAILIMALLIWRVLVELKRSDRDRISDEFEETADD